MSNSYVFDQAWQAEHARLRALEELFDPAHPSPGRPGGGPGLAVPGGRRRRGEHDIVNDPLEEAAFDLAHERVVLMYLPERERALARMVGAVRPGGWVVVEAIHVDAGLSQALMPYADPPRAQNLWTGQLMPTPEPRP